MNPRITLAEGASQYKQLCALSFPIILQNLITFSLGMIDTFMVSQLGNTAMSAVTVANAPAFLLISVVFGIQSGLGILVSQYWGKHDIDSINRSLGVAIYTGLGISLTLALLFFFFPIKIMDLLSDSHEMSVLGAPYLKIIGFSYVFNMLSSCYVSVQRSIGNPGFGMKVFSFSTVLNGFLNYLFIFGSFGFPRLEILGAAVATLLSRISEVTVCLIYSLREKQVPIRPEYILHPGRDMVQKFFKYSVPVTLNETAWGLGNSVLIVILGYTANSVEILAANSVTGNLNRLLLVVSMGFGASTAVIVGKAIGEGTLQEEVLALSKKLLRFTVLVGCGLAAAALLLLPTFFQPVIFPLFKLYNRAADIATAMAITSFVTIPLHAFTMAALTGVLRAGGDVMWGTILDLGPQWLLAVPLTALTALILKTDYWPICIAMQIECVLKVPFCLLRVNSGKWIHDVTTRPTQ